MMDKIAIIVGYAALLTTSVVCIVVLWFWISDIFAFKKYQKKSDEKIMDYAQKTDILEKSNTFIDALGEIIVVCKN